MKMFCRTRGRQKEAEHQEQEEQGREVAVLEGFQGDVRMPADNHPVDAEGQRENGNQGTEEDLQGIEPVVELAIFEHEDDRQQEDEPQGSSQPVDAEQGQRLHEAEVASEGSRESPQYEQQSHDEPVHGVPVAPVAQVDGEQARKLDASQYNHIHHGEEHGEVTGRRQTQLHVRQGFEGTPYAQHARKEADNDQHREAFGMHRNQVAHNQGWAHEQQDAAGGEPEFQAEEDGEDNRHAHKGGIAGHHHILLHQGQ